MEGATAANKLEKAFVGTLRGHKGEVTCLVAGNLTAEVAESRMLISSSRDKSILIWKLTPGEAEARRGQPFGSAYRSLRGHNHFVSSLVLSKDNLHLFSGSWDKTVRHWDLRTGSCTDTFSGSPHPISSITVSQDSRRIFTTGLGNPILLWNTKGTQMGRGGECTPENWVSRVCCSPATKNDYLASIDRDGWLSIWEASFECKARVKAHEEPITALAIAFNGMYIATGSTDKLVKIWNLRSLAEPFQTVRCNGPVNDVIFNPQMKIFAVATDADVAVFNLDQSVRDPNFTVELEKGQGKFSSVAWSADGKYLFCGCGNGDIPVYKVSLA